MKNRIRRILRPSWVVIAIIILTVVVLAISKSKDTKAVEMLQDSSKPAPPAEVKSFASHKNAGENENCLKCHGQSKYTYDNKETGKKVTKLMYAELIMDRTIFYESNHREFKCTDCHSEDYSTFPHPGNLRMEAKANCLDCHGGDEKYAKFNFENIDKEFQESVHSEKHSEDFTCWMCHNAHTYKINARTNEVIKKTIAYDNAICLECHGNITKYQLLTDKQNPNLIVKHEWLPNQILHFQSVRCIECHTKKMNDSTLVAHKILPKAQAVKKCAECHSNNSILMASLYKYQLKEVRSAKGFFGSIFTSDSYVIGANRNFYLNVISVIIFGFVIIGIIVHTVLRMLK
jgi:predicted CXXCH cytochrome family protein